MVTYKLSVIYKDGCKSWYYFDNIIHLNNKVKQLSNYGARVERFHTEILRR